MYVDIIPFLRLPKHTHTYTYKVPSEIEGDIRIGQFVEVPFRGRPVMATIARLDVQAPTRVKRIASVIRLHESNPSWNEARIRVLLQLSDLYGCSAPTLARNFIPDIPKRKLKVKRKIMKDVSLPAPIDEAGYEQAKRITLKALAQNSSVKYQHRSEALSLYQQVGENTDGQVLILCAQIQSALEIVDFLTDESDRPIFFLDPKANKTNQWSIWQQIRDSDRAIVIGTRTSIFAPLNHLQAIILDEEERSEHASWEAFPYFDARSAATQLANALNIPVLRVSLAPSIVYFSKSPILRFQSTPAPARAIQHDKTSPIFHHDLLAEIIEFSNSGRVPLIIASHKSISRTLHCLDCHHQWRCPTCGVNLVQTSNNLSCPNADYTSPIPGGCPNCRSLRLKSYGLGVKGLEMALNAIPGLLPVLSIHRESVPTSNELRQAKVIVSTPFTWKLVTARLPLGPIILFHPESLLFIPDYRSNELFYQLINWHRLVAHDYFNAPFIIQTKLQETDNLLNQVLSDDYAGFLPNELAMRSRLNYPPYVDLYKITLKSAKHHDIQTMHNALREKAQKPADLFGPRYQKGKGAMTFPYWLLKVPPKTGLNLDKLEQSIYSNTIIHLNPLQLA